jgi:adenylate kinase family enzyme
MNDTVEVNYMVFMDTTEEVMTERLMERAKTSGRADDKEDVIRERFKTYMDSTMPIIRSFEEDGKVLKIDAGKSVDEVFKELEEKLNLAKSS